MIERKPLKNQKEYTGAINTSPMSIYKETKLKLLVSQIAKIFWIFDEKSV